MSVVKIYPVSPAVAARALVDETGYQALYRQSMVDPEGFWAEQARVFIHWFHPWHTVLDYDFTSARIFGGLMGRAPTLRITAWIAIWPHGVIKQPLCGKGTALVPIAASPIDNSTGRSPVLPMR